MRILLILTLLLILVNFTACKTTNNYYFPEEDKIELEDDLFGDLDELEEEEEE